MGPAVKPYSGHTLGRPASDPIWAKISWELQIRDFNCKRFDARDNPLHLASDCLQTKHTIDLSDKGKIFTLMIRHPVPETGCNMDTITKDLHERSVDAKYDVKERALHPPIS